jgi:hypothetical protein
MSADEPDDGDDAPDDSIPAEVPDVDDSIDDDDDECVCQCIDVESQKRLWLRAIIPLLQLMPPDDGVDGDPDNRVARSSRLMRAAAYDRVRRILQSDVADLG